MILWSIQPEAGVRHLERTGVLRGDGRRLFLHERRFAFRWMSQQMAERLGPPRGSRYPVWAWKVWNGHRSARPDLRSRAHLPRGTRGARLEIDVPEKRVLLSDFSRWHFVLFNDYLYDDRREDEEMERKEVWRDRDLVRQSWVRIFELDRGDPAEFGEPWERSIQATLWSIELRDVRSITWFTAR